MYSAASLVAAARLRQIRIGEASSWWGWQWIRVARTWWARPVSVPQMLALQAARRDPLRYLVALGTVLRAVFPRRWWHRLVGDPVVLLLSLPDDLRTKVLSALLTSPVTREDVSRDEDPIEVIRRAQRAVVRGANSQGGVSLALATATVRASYGDSWYYDPRRWSTSDGYVPFAVALAEYEGVQALQAMRRLEIADGYAVVHAKDPRRARKSLESLAFPGVH